MAKRTYRGAVFHPGDQVCLGRDKQLIPCHVDKTTRGGSIVHATVWGTGEKVQMHASNFRADPIL